MRRTVYRIHMGKLPKTCCFFGHKEIYGEYNRLLPLLIEKVEQLIQDGFGVFLFGGYGQFDSMCHDGVRTLKTTHDIKTVYVQAYYKPHDSDMEYLQTKYDEIIFPEISVPRKFAISRRNQIMVDMSDLCIFHVTRNYGGAYQTLQYARRKGRKVLQIK